MTDLLNPIRRLTVRGEPLEVRELTWKELAHVLQELSGTALALVGANGQIILDREKLLAALAANESLLSWILEKATGRDAPWIGTLSLRELAPVLDALLDLNLHAETLAALKKTWTRTSQTLGLPKLLAAPSISSSAAATPLATPIV